MPGNRCPKSRLQSRSRGRSPEQRALPQHFDPKCCRPMPPSLRHPACGSWSGTGTEPTPPSLRELEQDPEPTPPSLRELERD
ncbi:hypothetical protein D623_10017938 [Myotis brandtii]|uniref:Uncharacterized protein n=1 Tax=Myotis brandtii TaxID=109478 RepID=S7ML25_MYOBR|nr:hypothetical protein D623_10017938 [Myotis brandtii]